MAPGADIADRILGPKASVAVDLVSEPQVIPQKGTAEALPGTTSPSPAVSARYRNVGERETYRVVDLNGERAVIAVANPTNRSIRS